MCKVAIFIIFFSIVCNTFNSFAQIRTDVPKSELDSLIRNIPHFQDKELIDHLNLIATSISQRYPDSCLYYAKKALELAKTIHYDFGEAVAVFNIGNGYFYKLDVQSATENYLTALRSLESLKPSVELGHLLTQIGYINTHIIQNHGKATEYFRNAVRIYKYIGSESNYLYALYRQATSFIHAKLYDSAFIYFKFLINHCKNTKQYRMLSLSYNGYGITHLWRDDYRPEEVRFEGKFAIPYFDSALIIARKINLIDENADYLTNLAECYHHYMNPPQRSLAEPIYYESIKAGYRIPNYANIASSHALLGELYADEKKLNLARLYLDSSLYSIRRFYSAFDTIVYYAPAAKHFEQSYMYWTKSFAYRGYFKLFKALAKYDSAIYYYRMMFNIIDSLKEQQNRHQIDYLLANAENEKVNNQISLLEQQKELERNKAQRSFYFLIGLTLLFVIAFLMTTLFIRQNNLKTEQEKTALQHKLLRSQMNPHFIFNSLASIQNSIINEEPQKASKYLARFSKLVRNILDSSVEELITLEQEISTIENYLELQKIRFPEKFDYFIEVEERLDPEQVRIPPILAQPFIENAIEHGIKHLETKGNIKVSITCNGNELSYIIEDNGIGREKANELHQKFDKDHKSLATTITQERIKVINKKLKRKITMEIIDLKDEQGEARGTKVVFGVPV